MENERKKENNALVRHSTPVVYEIGINANKK